MKPIVRLQLSVMMFIQFFIWGCWFVTMWKYLSKIGFDGSQTGNAYSTTGWAAMISPFFVGMIADRFFSTQKVLGVLHLAGGGMLFYLTTVTDPQIFFWVLLSYTLCYMPTLALVNSISFDQMTDPSKQFPGIRVLGTIGWIAAGLLIGLVVPKWITGQSIENTELPFWIAGWVSLFMGVYCFFLPHTPPKSLGKRISAGDVLGLKALGLMKQPSFAIFVACSFLICIPLSFYFQSANGFLGEVGMEYSASKMTLGQVSEIFFMLLMPFFFIRLGVKWMLVVGMLFWTGRYLLFAFGDADSLIFMLYLGILFHGICYDFFFVTGQIYVDRKAPREIRANAQGFIAFVTLGAGMVIGNYINGYVTEHFSFIALDDKGADIVKHHWRQIWMIPAIMAGFVAAGFVVLFKDNVFSFEENSSSESAPKT